MSLEITGILKEILPIESGKSKAGKEWKKQSFVIDTNAEYNPLVCFGLFGDKVSELIGLNPGAEITVSFNVSSREFNQKWYHNLDAWKIKTLRNSNYASDHPQSDEDDLPFG